MKARPSIPAIIISLYEVGVTLTLRQAELVLELMKVYKTDLRIFRWYLKEFGLENIKRSLEIRQLVREHVGENLPLGLVLSFVKLFPEFILHFCLAESLLEEWLLSKDKTVTQTLKRLVAS